MTAPLLDFVKQALAQNASRADIAATLQKAGWDNRRIEAALDAFADIGFAVPVPKPRSATSAREVFLYLLMFSTLYGADYNLGALLFEFVNRAIPDPAQARNLYSLLFDQTRWNISSLIVSVPVFLYMFYLTHVAAAAAGRRDSRPRRWLTYITLYLMALSMIGDLVSLVYSLLGGELTLRFTLKTLVVALIAGGNFTFFLWDARQGEKP